MYAEIFLAFFAAPKALRHPEASRHTQDISSMPKALRLPLCGQSDFRRLL